MAFRAFSVESRTRSMWIMDWDLAHNFVWMVCRDEGRRKENWKQEVVATANIPNPAAAFGSDWKKYFVDNTNVTTITTLNVIKCMEAVVVAASNKEEP